MSTPVATPKTVVLNVNDTDSMRIAISAMLRHAGFEVLEAATGEEALEVIERNEPHVVILDINLPGANGYEVCRRVRANPFRSTMRILLTSATNVSLEDKIETLECGADGFLEQPFELESLFSCVRSLLDDGQAGRPRASKQTAPTSATLVQAAETVASEPPPADHILQTLEHLTDGVMCLDNAWRVTFVNAMAERVLGRTREALLGQVIWMAQPALQASALGTAYRRAMAERTVATVDGIRPAFNAFMRARLLPTAQGLLVLFQNMNAGLGAARSARRARADKAADDSKRAKTLRGL